MRTSILLSALFIANTQSPYPNWPLLIQVLILGGLGFCVFMDLAWLGHEAQKTQQFE